MVDREDKIRQRAYSIWEEEGHPHGRADDHWHRAAREMGAARADAGSADVLPDVGEAPSLQMTEAASAEKPAPRRRKASTTAAAAAKPRKRTVKKS